jgi:hypothetical protein
MEEEEEKSFEFFFSALPQTSLNRIDVSTSNNWMYVEEKKRSTYPIVVVMMYVFVDV